MSRIAVLLASRNRPDLLEAAADQLGRPSAHDLDLFVAECGTGADKLSSRATLVLPPGASRGLLHGQALLFEHARRVGRYDHFFALTTDAELEGDDPVGALVDQLEREPRLGLLAPADGEASGVDWRPVTTCAPRALLLRGDAVREVGFLDTDFEQGVGALDAYAYALYGSGWAVACSERVACRPRGADEAPDAGAMRAAYDRLRALHGEEWPAVFLAATREHPVAEDTFAAHRDAWLAAFDDGGQRERRTAHAAAVVRRRSYAARLEPRDEVGLVRLQLGPADEREGWTKVDAAPDRRAHAVTSLATHDDASVDVIEVARVFETLTRDQAVAALAEWRRVLKPGGELYVECPDLERCVALLGRHADEAGDDLALVGLFGSPADVAADGAAVAHKWGWTRTTLRAALEAAGFDEVDFGPSAQAWRPAARLGRDLRARAAVAGPPPLVLAWPRIDRPEELEHLFATFGPALLDDSRARLAIYVHAEETDRQRALDALDAAYAAVLGDVGLAIELLEGPLPKEAAAKLSERCVAVCDLPSLRGRGAAALSGLMAPWVADANELSAALSQRSGGATKRIALTE